MDKGNKYEHLELTKRLVKKLWDRFDMTENVEDLDEAIRLAREIIEGYLPDSEDYRSVRNTVDATSKGQSGYLNCLNDLADLLHLKYIETHKLSYLDESISIAETLCGHLSGNGEKYGNVFCSLADSLYERYLHTKIKTDLDESLRRAREAAAILIKDRWGYRICIQTLSRSLSQQCYCSNDKADLDELVRLETLIVEMTPVEDPDYKVCVQSLARAIGNRYRVTKESGNLQDCIHFLRKFVYTTSSDYPKNGDYLRSLGNAMRVRFTPKNTGPSIGEVIDLVKQTHQKQAPGYFDRLRGLRNLALQHIKSGNSQRAVEIGEELFRESRPGCPYWLGCVGVLVSALWQRHLRIGAFQDLEQAIQLAQDALRAIPDDSPDYASWLSTLAGLNGDRFARTNSMDDLERSIELAKDALDRMQGDNPAYLKCLNTLAVILMEKWTKTRDIAGLEQHMQSMAEKVQQLSPDTLQRGNCFHTLAVYFEEKYDKSSDLADLDTAIKYARRAVEADPSEEDNSITLATGLTKRHLLMRKETDLEESLDRFALAFHHPSPKILSKIEAGRQVVRICAMLGNWQRAYKVSKIMMNTLSLLSLRSLQNSDKEYLMRQLPELASDMAAVALRAAERPVSALMLLELGRGLILMSLDEIRADIQDLQHESPKLADRFMALCKNLEKGKPDENVGSDLELSLLTTANQRFGANREFDALVSHIRKQPRCHSFLQAFDEAEIRDAASRGPVAVINTSRFGCHVFLIGRDQVKCFPLPALSVSDIDRMGHEEALSSPLVLEWLWDTVADPVLAQLGFNEHPVNGKWPHMWWVLTGSLSKFPMHAAGYHYEGSVETVCDRVMSSYSSSIRTILRNRKRAPFAHPNQALLVSMENTPGHSFLPFAREEAELFRNFCQTTKIPLLEPERDKLEILSKLGECSIFHFAGHCATDGKHPLSSRLLLGNRPSDDLSVADLLETNLHQHTPFLANLSACGTGRISDPKLTDESIHLVSAAQLAGFRHVIGTLWEADDKVCTDMNRLIYQTLDERGLSDEAICWAQHEASRQLRDMHLSHESRASQERKATRRQMMRQEKVEAAASRDIVSCDEDRSPQKWVPFVHFGV